MTAVLIVTIEVDAPDRDGFDQWYEATHLGPSMEALGACRARRGWSALNEGRHVALYEFESLDAARRGLASAAVRSLVQDYSRVWGSKTRMSSELVGESQRLG